MYTSQLKKKNKKKKTLMTDFVVQGHICVCVYRVYLLCINKYTHIQHCLKTLCMYLHVYIYIQVEYKRLK